MAKINNKVVRVGTVKKELYKLNKDDVEKIVLTYGMIRGHRKYVEIYTKDTKLNIEVTYNEFGNIELSNVLIQNYIPDNRIRIKFHHVKVKKR